MTTTSNTILPTGTTTQEQERGKPGYKKTKLGWIPEDWGVIRIGDAIKYIKGFAFKSKDFEKKGRRIIRVSDTSFNGIKDSDPAFIREDVAKNYLRYSLQEGDLIFSTVGSRPPLYDSMVGRVVKVARQYEGSLLNQNAVKVNVDKRILDQDFFFNNFKTVRYVYHVEANLRGNANQASITLNDLFDFKIPLPPLPEQRQIAQILSTWDRAIEKTEQLIAAKEKRKKGLMQQLLTGRVRFEGFDGEEWENKKLKEIGKIVLGGTPKTNEPQYWNGKIDWCTPTDITELKGSRYLNTTFKNISEKGLKNSSAKLLPSYSVIICTRATIGELALNSTAMATNQGFKSIVPNKDNTEFLYYKLSTIKPKFLSLSHGSTFLEINRKDFENIKINIPKNFKEQQKIASVLNACDREIEQLKDKLDKLKEQKRGLMQALLSGEKRLQQQY